MNWKSHLVLAEGLLGTIIMSNIYFKWIILEWWQYLVLVIIIAVGALLPDIDIETSKPRKIISVLILLTIVYAFISDHKILGIALALLLLGILFLKHRKFTHSIWFVMLVGIPLIFINTLYGAAFTFAILTHYLGDAFKTRRR